MNWKESIKNWLYCPVLFLFLGSTQVQAYTYKPRSLNVRTTAYTHSESDHIEYGRKTAFGTKLKFTREYSSAAADWSKFPVGTEFRIKGINRHFVIDDYGSALLGKDTIDIYFPSKKAMNRWGVQHVDIIITKYGDYHKSSEILAQRTKHDHCRTMLIEIEKNLETSRGVEIYEPVPEIGEEIDEKLMAAASIPKSEWKLPAPPIEVDSKQPVESESPVLLASANPEMDTESNDRGAETKLETEIEDSEASSTLASSSSINKKAPYRRRLRPFREIFATARQPSRKRLEEQTITVHLPVFQEREERHKRTFRPLSPASPGDQ